MQALRWTACRRRAEGDAIATTERSSTNLQILLHPDLILAIAGSELSLFLHGQPHILSARKSVPVRQCRVLSLLHAPSEVTIKSMGLT